MFNPEKSNPLENMRKICNKYTSPGPKIYFYKKQIFINMPGHRMKFHIGKKIPCLEAIRQLPVR